MYFARTAAQVPNVPTCNARLVPSKKSFKQTATLGVIVNRKPLRTSRPVLRNAYRELNKMKSEKPNLFYKSHAVERGAALITTVLLSMLLLAAGGILILTSTMTSTTARDATAEMQAYYAAEAGVARTLEVLRGNVQSNP